MSPCNEHASTWHPPLLAVGEPKIFQAPKIFQVLRKYLNWNYLHDTYTEHVRHRSTQLVQLLILCNRSRDVLRIVTGRVWALTSAQYPGLCCDKVQCHHRHPAISPDHLLISDRASISNTLIVTARPARSLVMRMMSGSIVHQDYHRDSPSGDQRTHIPRLVSLPCCCTTLLPGTLSKMSINKMTFNRKVKIGSLLTAWHRYLVIDLYITIPNLREAEREPSTHSAVHRPEKLLQLDCFPFRRIKKEVVWVSPRMIIMAVVLIALNITN